MEEKRENVKRWHVKERHIFSSLLLSFLSSTCRSAQCDTHTHGVGICGAFSVTRVST